MTPIIIFMINPKIKSKYLHITLRSISSGKHHIQKTGSLKLNDRLAVPSAGRSGNHTLETDRTDSFVGILK